ncbi:NUDIX domain-containing protein [Lysobacter sp. S4-A87]|uniref:NUDIX domain-containing protein n=1 Tax=Lysobacter sp. S4-A87 TaxID=2925843 RepID=UPI001F534133|nr:NUDIX domain-containing protein [Lysobacter sp. S4-A87]UNK48499.1 NUDIX domain-containing protein [Lysobacter sp. S4-A87]
MQLNPRVFDVWAFRRDADAVRYLLLHSSQHKADRYFNGGRFWQLASGARAEAESMTQAIDRVLAPYGIEASAIWAAEHAYTIYNRRFDEMQLVSVFAAQVDADEVRLNPLEHADYRWVTVDEALALVHYRGLKDGLRSVVEYVTGVASPARELCLRGPG